MNITKSCKVIAAALLAGALTLGTAGYAGAEILEGGGVPSPSETCPETLMRFLDSHDTTYPDAKMRAIVGLEGDHVAQELDRVRASIAERCE